MTPPTPCAEPYRPVVRLHAAQLAYLQSDAPLCAYVGGVGSGKTYVGALRLLRAAAERPGITCGVYAPTYPMMRDATAKTLLLLADELRLLKSFARADMEVRLVTGATAILRSLDDPDRARGPNLSEAWIDEASLLPEDAYRIIMGRLREGGRKGRLSCTFTPRGLDHWTYAAFGREPLAPGTACFRSASSDNPFLPPGFVDHLRAHYPGQFARQELGGDFVQLGGSICQREWLRVHDAAPVVFRRKHRHWDLAATEKTAASTDPDWTCGALMGEDEDGRWWILDMVRVRVGPGALVGLIRATAGADGRAVPLTVEQEPGSSGKAWSAQIVRDLAGFDCRAVPVTGDKVARALPWLRQAEVGNLHLAPGRWVPEFISEAVAFPSGRHDDQMDAVSGAFAALAKASSAGWFRPVALGVPRQNITKRLESNTGRRDTTATPAGISLPSGAEYGL